MLPDSAFIGEESIEVGTSENYAKLKAIVQEELPQIPYNTDKIPQAGKGN